MTQRRPGIASRGWTFSPSSSRAMGEGAKRREGTTPTGVVDDSDVHTHTAPTSMRRCLEAGTPFFEPLKAEMSELRLGVRGLGVLSLLGRTR